MLGNVDARREDYVGVKAQAKAGPDPRLREHVQGLTQGVNKGEGDG